MLPVPIVDDDPAIRNLLTVICRRSGLCADVAEDGAEALEKMGAHQYSLALVDLMMPRLNGYQLIDKMRGAERAPTVFIVTAMAESYLAELEGTVRAIIRKPFDVEVVGKLISETVREV